MEHDDEIVVAGEEHVDAIVEQDQTMMTAQSHSELAVQHDDAIPSVIDAVPKKSINDELTTSADRVRDQEHPGAETTTLGTKADQKPRKYVLESGENLFHSLYATDKTPPTSPGSASSSSTLVDPSSRKVSPSDSTMGSKSSPIAAKDFAYSSLDEKHVRDPLSIVEENTKLELLWQLKNKTIGEKMASRAAEKRKAKNLALSAELDATKEKLRSKEVEADVTRTHANALILSNFALRNAMQDDTNAPRDEQHGVEVETTKSAGGMIEHQGLEGDLQNNFRPAGTSVASAYSHGTVLSESPDEFGEGLAHAGAQDSIQQEQMPPTSDNSESEHLESNTVEDVHRRASEEPQTALIGSRISASASASQLEGNAEGFLGRSKGKVDDLSKEIRSDELATSGTMTSVESSGSKVFKEGKAQGQKDPTDDIGIASNQDDQGASSSINRTQHSENSNTQVQNSLHGHDQKVEQKTYIGHSIAHDSTHLLKSTNSTTNMSNDARNMAIEPRTEEELLSELSDIGHTPISHDKKLPIKVEHQADDKSEGEEDEDEDEVIYEDDDDELFDQDDDVKGKCIGREGVSHDPFEFSEPAGPATLWGILQTNQEDEAAEKVNAVEEAATVSDAAGPATLWGILHSHQSEQQAKHTTVADRNTAELDLDTEAPANSAAVDPVDQGGWEPNPDPDRPRQKTDFEIWAEQNPEEYGVFLQDEFGKKAPHGTGSEAGETAPSPKAEASPVASAGVPEDVGAKSNDSDFVALAHPSEPVLPVEMKCPGKPEGENVEAPAVLHTQGVEQHDFAAAKNHQTTSCDGDSGNTRADTCKMASRIERQNAPSRSPIPPDTETPYVSFSRSPPEHFDFIPPMRAPAPGPSKTQKRKLERKRAAAKKAEEAQRSKEVEEEPAGVEHGGVSNE